MKKFILAAAAASILAVPAAAAPFGRHGNGYDNRVSNVRVVTVKHGNKHRFAQARKWRKGERFQSRYASNYRVIGNPRSYRLRDAPRGYRWVQSGNDAVLIAITSGIVGAVLGGVFN